MARHKDWWTGRLFSYGPNFRDNKIEGFHITVKADDHTESGRVIEIPIDAATLRRIADSFDASEEKHGATE